MTGHQKKEGALPIKNDLQPTEMLDYLSAPIQNLTAGRGWSQLNACDRIGSIYRFVRDEILFGYNVSDEISASQVLRDGFGQCNTKATLLMALLRVADIPCRLHGFAIDKQLQKGAMTGVIYRFAPQEILHSWVEVWLDGTWYHLEGVILDLMYLRQLQRQNATVTGPFCGYGVAVLDFRNPVIDWNQNDTYIQSEGICRDFGVFNSPDAFFESHRQALPVGKEFIYRHIGRRIMNHHVGKIRQKV